MIFVIKCVEVKYKEPNSADFDLEDENTPGVSLYTISIIQLFHKKMDNEINKATNVSNSQKRNIRLDIEHKLKKDI